MDPSSWPMPVVVAMAAAAGLAAAALIGVLASRFSPFRADTDAQSTIYDVAKLIGGVIGLFMLFSLTQGMNYYRSAEIATYKEAGDLLQLDHALAGIPAMQGEPARRALHEYGRLLVEREWPAMRHLRGSEHAEHGLERLQHAVSEVLSGAPEAAALRSVQKNFEDIEDDRTTRIGAAESGVPTALWWTLAGMFGLLAISLFFMAPDKVQFRIFALYLASLSMLAALLFMVDGPYRGSFSVSPSPVQHALARMLKA